MFRFTMQLLLAVICLFYSSVSHAQLPQISTGLSYLTSSQNPDGTWQTNESEVEITAATVSVLETLKLLNQTADSAYTAGTAWLQGQAPQSVTYMAERIHALNLADGSVNGLMPLLDTIKGGWGGFEDYEITTRDTSLALQALKTANYADLSVINSALAYLIGSQNPDGGWGLTAGDDSSVFLTAIVAATLQQFPQTMPIVTALNKGTAFLISRQNADGGYGTNPSDASSSTVFETALAYIALVQGGQTQGAPLQGALTYLTAAQSPNGSWNDDPYSTALALRALHLSENPPGPLPPEPTTGTVMGTVVDATSGAPLGGVSVTLAGAPTPSTVTNSAGAFTLPNIPRGAQQLALVAAGYAPLTVTTQIAAGTFVNVGKVALSVNPTTGTIMGTVWDGEANAPYGGVVIEANSNGAIYHATSAPDGSYRISGVNPGPMTVGAINGPKLGYWNPAVAGTLAPGGIFVYNPFMSSKPMFMKLALHTDRAIYARGETVTLEFVHSSTRIKPTPGTLFLTVLDPTGTVICSADLGLYVEANSTDTASASFVLPADAQGGFYTVRAETYDGWTGSKIASSTTSFGVFKSQIEVTPNLPARLTRGANSISFDLANKGNMAVSSGLLAVTLKDPDGREIASLTQPFTLGQRENKTLTFDLSFPALKFGSYTLSYRQSDETTSGQEVALSLQNSLEIAPLFDKPSYKIRETANLLTTLKNTGRFSLDSVTVNMSLPDLGFTDTRTIALEPGNSLNLLNSMQIPETMTAGDHVGSITLTLPGGSTVSKNITCTVPQSSLVIGYVGPETVTAGDTLILTIENSGGINSGYNSGSITIVDSKGVQLYQGNAANAAILAGEKKTLIAIVISGQAASGSVFLNSQVKDSVTGNIATFYKTLTLAGVSVNLQAATDQLSYPLTGRVTAMASIANNGAALEGGSLKFTVRNGGSAVPLNGLRLWLKADAGVSKDASGFVSWWADQSGNNFNVTQGNYLKQPRLVDSAVNGKSVIRFDGNNDYLQTAGRINLLNNVGNYSLFVVVKPGATQKTWADILDYQHDPYGLLLQQDYNVTNKFYVGAPSCPGDGHCPNGQILAINNYQLYSAFFQKSSFLNTFVNGANQKTQGAYITPFGDPKYFTVGNKSLEALPRQFNGDIAEIMIYNTALADSDRIAVEKHLSSKYAIDAALPQTNDTLYETVIPVTQGANTTSSYSADIGLLNVTGKLYLNTELKNSLGQVIGTTESQFYIVQGSFLMAFTTDKKLYKPGETVTVSGEVRNLSAAAAANLSLLLKTRDAAKTVQTIHSANMTIPAGESQPFTVTTTAGAEGGVTLTGILTQSGATLAEIADQYEVASPKVTATLSGPDSAASEVNLALSLANSGKAAAAVTIATSFGSPAQTVTVPAGETRILHYQQKLTADTTLIFTLSGDLAQQLTKSIAYVAPKQGATLSAKMVTDRLSYNAGEKVALTATITCQDPGTTGDPLAAGVMIVAGNGEALFTDVIGLAPPETGRVYTNSRYWNSAAYPPGSYTARVTVAGGGVTLATGEATFTILPSLATAAGVTGTLGGAANPVYLGIDQNLAVTLANGGNEDLTGATYSVIVVNPDTGATMQTYDRSVAIPRQGSVSDTVVVPTTSLEERDYLAVLQIRLPGMPGAKSLAGFAFGVKIAPPPTLSLSTLSHGAVTNNQTLNMTGSVTGVVAIKSLVINGADVPFTVGGGFSHALLLQPGSQDVTIVATDILGHTIADSRTITLDQSAPSLTIDSPADNGTTAVSPIEVKGRVDETSTVTVRVKDTVRTAAMNGTDFTATVVPDLGWNTIEITATDLAGNPNSLKRSVLFDDQIPSLSVTEPDQDSRTNKESLTVGGKTSDPYSGVGITVAFEGTILTPTVIDGTFSQTVTFGEEKLYPIIVIATNGVGTQTTVQRNIIYDKTPPVLTIDPVASPTNVPDQVVTGTREDGTEVQISCATATLGTVEYPTPTSWRVAVSGMSEGENRLTAETVDIAGNRTTAGATILYVPKAPEVTVSANPDRLWPPNKRLVPVVLDGTVVTYGSDVREMTISVADEYGVFNQQGLRFGDTVLLEAWREGSDRDGRIYTVTAVVTDQAGNVTTRSATVAVPHDMGE